MKLTAWKRFACTGHFSTHPAPHFDQGKAHLSNHPYWKVMKLTVLLFFIAVLHVSAKTTAQKINISERNITVEKLFNRIKLQTGYSFLWDDQLLSKSYKVSVNVKNGTIDEILQQCLKGLALTYKIENNIVYILKMEEKRAITGPASPSPSPPTDIHGHITDSLGNPLAGASVTVKGSNKGTTTDAGGNFILKGIDNSATLVISFTGYETQQIKLNGRNEVSIQLKQAVTSLQDVVVNKGYYSVRQRENTGNISIVDSKTIQEQPVSDLIQALIGRVPGLNIQQNSGISGAYANIHIRGINSIANGNNPLYIIDGVPFSAQSLSALVISNALGNNNGFSPNSLTTSGQSPFSALNLNDIESIEVLKDADATAIYGSRGANGVILITTKKGKAGATKVDLDYNQGWGSVARTMDLLNTKQYLAMRREAYKNDGIAFPNINTNPSDPYYDVNGVYDTTRYTNWQKIFIGNTAHYSNAQASMSGGNANTQFLVGAGYNRQTTVFPGDYSDKKASVHFSLNHLSENQKFHAQLTASYVNDVNDIPQTDLTSNITLAPDAPALYNADGSVNLALRNGVVTFSNPIVNILRTSTSVTNNLVTNADLGYWILPHLLLKTSIGYIHDELNENLLLPATSYYPPNNTNPLARLSNFGNTVFQTWIIEPQLNYDQMIAGGKLSIIAGTTFQQNTQNSSTQQARGFSSDALISSPSFATTYRLLDYTNNLYHYNAVYARIGYDFKEKYILNLTARRDGSSRFGQGKQFGNFGAAGAAWIFSEEKFVKDALPFLSFGKLKGSYGITGNDQTIDYQYLSTYSPNSTTYQGNIGLYPTSLTNPYYGWETVKKLEIGTELGFLKDRIDLSVDYYRNRTTNQLVGYPLPFVTGFSSIQYNLPAIIQNTGLEAELHTVNLKSSHFTWSTDLSFTLPENKLVSFPGLATSPYNGQYFVGKSLFTLTRYQYTGVNPQTGLYTFATNNSNGLPSYPQDWVQTAPITQKYYGGLQSDLKYKNFGFSFFLQFVKQLGFNYLTSFITPGTLANQPTAVLDRWQKPGDNAPLQAFTTGLTSSPAYSLYNNYLKGSTASISDASFIRLKNVTVYYMVPTHQLKVLGVRSTKIYFQAQNLLTITNYLGLDPETQGLSLPPLRMITLGLQASF